MRRFVSALLLGLAAGTASHAQGRPPLPHTVMGRMICAEAMALVKREGEITVPTGRGAPERLVRDRSFCDLAQVAELRLLPTRDNPQCPVGYLCREPGFDEWDW